MAGKAPKPPGQPGKPSGRSGKPGERKPKKPGPGGRGAKKKPAPEVRVVSRPKDILAVAMVTRTAVKRIETKGLSIETLRMGLDSSAIRGLFDKKLFPAQTHDTTVGRLQNFLHTWVNRNAGLNVRMHEEAQAMAKAKGISNVKAFNIVLGQNREIIQKRLVKKAALEQLLFVWSSHRAARRREEIIDSVKPTAVTKSFGKTYYGPKDKPGSVVKLAEAVARIPMHHAPSQVAEAYYGLPTASETLMANGILTFFKSKNPLWGCGMRCDVINAVLNGWGMENYHVRTKTWQGDVHSVVLVRPEKERGLWLLADPFRNGRLFLHDFERYSPLRGRRTSLVVSQVGQVLGDHIKKLEGKGEWRKGRGLTDHVKNFVQYYGGN